MNKVTAYILFLDLQGYSKLKDQEQIKLVKVLYEETASIISLCKEKILDTKTVGDSFIIYFEDQLDCIDTAYKIQTLFSSDFIWKKHEIKKVKCRIALHTGELFLLTDYVEGKPSVFGKSIVTAARLEPSVRPNEVWCTPAFYHATTDKDAITNKYLFEDIGTGFYAKDYGATQLYALYKDGEEKPAKIALTYQLSKKSLSTSQRQYIVLLRLDPIYRGSPVDSLHAALKTFDGTIDSIYYIYGLSDVLLRFHSPTEITKSSLTQALNNCVKKPGKKQKFSLIRKDHASVQIMQVGAVYSGQDNFALIEEGASYDFHSFIAEYHELGEFKSFIYLQSGDFDKNKEHLSELAETVRNVVGSKTNFLNIYVSTTGTILVLEVILKTTNYHRLSTLVEAIENLCDEKQWSITKSVTYPVHGLETL